ncbi:uncharacterized protein LOC115356175 [Myripristis murdjan]|uniref:uncharacterized protein LOC115356175 n=1 Tax=Myripristis murdjan TaxID=586833 RepID=UPI0011762E8B|nr:uncharacterized protein LOC115356175 [Myripristis murdjan]
MDYYTPTQRNPNTGVVPLFCGFAFGSAAVTAHEASSILSADNLHPMVVKMARIIGTAGVGAVLFPLALGLATLMASAGLVMGALSTASGPMMTLGAMGAGLLIGTGLQTALSFGVSGLLVTVTVLLLVGYVIMQSHNHRQTIEEWMKDINASHVMVMLAMAFTGNLVAVVFGMAEGTHIEKSKGKALQCLAGVRVILMILYILLILLRIVMSKNLWSAFGNLPYYTAINFQTWVFPLLAVMGGFVAGLGAASEAEPESEADVALMLSSVLWVGVLSAGLLGAAIGAVAMVGLGAVAAERVAMEAAVTSSVALRLLLPACHVTGVVGSVGGLLGGAVVAGGSMAMASHYSPINGIWCCLGALLGSGCFFSLGKISTFTVLVIAGAGTSFPSWEEAARIQFDLLVLSAYLETSVEGAIISALLLGLTTVGSALLGGAALWTAALGKVGTLGVLGAALVSLGVSTMERLRTLENPVTFVEMAGSLTFTFAILSGIELTYFILK